jgi:hypothetical protein
MPTPTKADLDAELVARWGGQLANVGRSVVVDGTNPDTIGAIRDGLASLGLGVAAFAAVADADLASVPVADIPQLLDVAEYRLLQNIIGWSTEVTQSIGMGSQNLGDLRKDLIGLLKMKYDNLRSRYGLGAATVTRRCVDVGCNPPCSEWG